MEPSLSETDRGVLTWEVLIVLAIAIGPYVIESVAEVSGLSATAQWQRVWHQGALLASLRDVLVMLLVLHLVGRSGSLVSSLGLRPRISSVPLGLALALVILAVKVLVRPDVFSLAPAVPRGQVALRSFLHESPIWLIATYLLCGTLMEELVVRAYLMTRMRELGASWLAAIAGSTLVEASYHLHHGYGLLGTALVFLLLSIVFAWRRDFWTIAIAHVLYDWVVMFVW